MRNLWQQSAQQPKQDNGTESGKDRKIQEKKSTSESGCFSSMAANGDTLDAGFAGVDAFSGQTRDTRKRLWIRTNDDAR